jgi:hypothetical protein
MKKIFFLPLLFLLSAFASAQNSAFSMSGNGDTLTVSETEAVDLRVRNNYQTVSFEAVVTKISGTVDGYAILQASNDGTNYKDLNTDSLSFANQTTNKKIWIIDNSPYVYYRISFVSSDSMSAKVYGYAFPVGKMGAGVSSSMLSVYSNTTDTVTNAATKTLTLPVTKAWYKTITIQAVVTKISGTAAGTVTLQGSNDGSNYVTVSSSYSDAQTLSVSNTTTNTKLFKITGTPYLYYRLSYTGSGTMACKIKGYLFAQPQ